MTLLHALKYIVVDVDGTLTDGGIYYDENGNESKKFCTKDAAGFFAAAAVGIQMVVLTGRSSAATDRRMKELGVNCFYQGVRDKQSFLQEFMREKCLCAEEMGYIGDDLNDLAAMKIVQYIGCPADACPEIRDIAQYVSSLKGGAGAVRDIVEHILRERGEWDAAIANIYGKCDKTGC